MSAVSRAGFSVFLDLVLEADVFLAVFLEDRLRSETTTVTTLPTLSSDDAADGTIPVFSVSVSAVCFLF